jgi:predicted DCC family thiol-disulfide oxidoreductase YuxK
MQRAMAATKPDEAELASPACYASEADPFYMMAPPAGPVLLFDGVCVLCSGTVGFILAHERDHDIRFATMQSRIGQALLRLHGLPVTDWDSVVFIVDGRPLERSRAALALARHLRAPWRWLRAAAIVPRPLRDRIYDWIARNRYRWFGRRDACLVPDAATRARFLD